MLTFTYQPFLAPLTGMKTTRLGCHVLRLHVQLAEDTWGTYSRVKALTHLVRSYKRVVLCLQADYMQHRAIADERHCVNSISLNFKGDDGKTLEG